MTGEGPYPRMTVAATPERGMTGLANTSPPVTLRMWAFQTCRASFPANQVADVWNHVDVYLDWLDSLPVLPA